MALKFRGSFMTCGLKRSMLNRLCVTVVAASIVLNILLVFHLFQTSITKAQQHQTTPEITKKTSNTVSSSSPKRSRTTPRDCPRITSIHEQKEVERYSRKRVCQPTLPTAESCRYTAKSFKADPSIEICHDQPGAPYRLCGLSQHSNPNETDTFLITCDLSACDKRKNMNLTIIDPSNGEHVTLDLPGETSNEEMEAFLEIAAKRTQRNGFHFLFVECVGLQYGVNISQMLTLLPSKDIFKKQSGAQGGKINVNIVVLDSVARAHFYRSLPKTVQYLRQKQGDSSYKAHLFDFELFQSVHGHTHENEHAFFAGELYPESFTKEEKESAPSNMERLFGIFKKAGYQTLGQNDMCWKSYYGFIDSFRGSDWKDLQEKLKAVNSNIDSTGITDTSCKIFANYDDISPFNDGEDHQICYNGQHQHKYFFNYLTDYFQAVHNMNDTKPLFAYTETNVNHDDVGVRVRTLDRDLPEFIDTMANQPNTITIMYADHGNTYTAYQYSMLEGRLEMYHPTLLAIVPKQLDRKLGHAVLNNMKTNQYRLLTLLDVRAGIVAIANHDPRSEFRPAGIFGPISKNRTCDDLKLSTPNYCICEGWDMKVENTTHKLGLAEFGIGELNRMIQDGLVRSRENHTKRYILKEDRGYNLFGNCQKLVIHSIDNVLERHLNGTLVTTMDVRVHSGNVVDQQEIFMLQVGQQRKGKDLELRLMSFNRISKYGHYRECADAGVHVKLCVCNKPTSNASRPNIFGKNPDITTLKPCLLLIHRKFEETGEDTENAVTLDVYELANTCSNIVYTVFVDAETRNFIRSTRLPTVVKLKPRTTYFLMFMVKEVDYYETELNWRLAIRKELL